MGVDSKNIKKGFHGVGHAILLSFFIIFIVMSTVFGRWPRNPYQHILDHLGVFYEGNINYEAFENVVLYMPYGFFFTAVHRTKNPFITTLNL